jgi:acyl carrier protein
VLEFLLPEPAGNAAPLTAISLVSWGTPTPGEAFWRRELGSLRRWVLALDSIGHRRPVRLILVTSGGAAVAGEAADSRRVALTAILDTLRLEFPYLTPCFVDLPADAADGAGAAEAHALLREVRGAPEGAVALRGHQRWLPGFEALPLETQAREIPPGACLLLGLGALGRGFAGELARMPGCPLVVVTRRPLAADGPGAGILAELRQEGHSVEAVHGDLEDPAFVRALVERVRGTHGGIAAVVHAAGPGGSLPSTTLEAVDGPALEVSLAATERRLVALEDALAAGPEPGFCLISSCLVSLAGGLGATAAALNHRYLEARVAERNRGRSRPWTVVTWDAWNFEATAAERQGDQSLLPQQGARALRDLLHSAAPEAVLVSRRDVERWLKDRSQAGGGALTGGAGEDSGHDRPQLTTPYAAPSNPLEERLVGLFQELLGIRKIGIHDNFFELGGSSLMAAKAISRVREEFGVAPPLAKLFEEATPAGLAGLVAAAQMVSTAPAPAAAAGAGADDEREVGEI